MDAKNKFEDLKVAFLLLVKSLCLFSTLKGLIENSISKSKYVQCVV